MANQVKNLELGQEYPTADEADAIQKIIQIHVESFLNRNARPVQRTEHPKHHGCVRAEFTIAADVPVDLQVGIFSQPRSFPAWIRFSNGQEQDDQKFDSRGMAIKLMDVPGPKVLDAESGTQDFVMINYPQFFIRDLDAYVDFFSALQKASLPLRFFIPSLNPRTWRLRELWIAGATLSQNVKNPLLTQYWSTTPYKLGDRAIKFSAKPAVVVPGGLPWGRSEHYLRQAMVKSLQGDAAMTFDFLIQVQTDPVQMPVEDSTRAWAAPWIKVATIRIPQTFDTEAQMTFCENLSFTPWHTRPEHQPLGAINRARRQTYQTLSHLRHELNHRPPQEPLPEES
jgi:Catalase